MWSERRPEPTTNRRRSAQRQSTRYASSAFFFLIFTVPESPRHLVKKGRKLPKSVYVVPQAIDKEVARLKLKSMGIDIDVLTPEQVKYLATWSEGT